jgi:hypothetical protein
VVERYVVGPDLSEEYDVGATCVIRGYDGYRAYLYDLLLRTPPFGLERASA